MTNFEKAIKLSFDEWCNNFDEKLTQLEQQGEIPIKSEEQLKAEAHRIWNLAHKSE